ncbi:MAG: tetratricopeptide repeat protein [Terracidiphilus sp.]|jgi:tetratricopeptide (TPR) repeat protein
MTSKSRQRKSRDKRPTGDRGEKGVSIGQVSAKPWQIAAVCVLLAVVTVVAYRGVRGNDFLRVDDDYYILENRNVQQGLTIESIGWAFTSYYAGNWHPLTWISHMIDWSLYGRNPAGYHVTNLCLHAANAILLFLFLLYLTGYLARSAMVAFLFALHPAHVESVAWIAERKDVLCAFFWFAALLGYVWYARRPSWKRLACVAIAFGCGLLSKPMIVTLPFTLLLLDIWPLRRITFSEETCGHWVSSFWKLCLEKWPLFVMAGVSSVITFMAQRAGGAVSQLQLLPLPDRILNAAISCWSYVRITFWPDPLTVYYYYDFNHISYVAAGLAFAGLIAVTAVCWHFRKDKPYCLVGWLWFLGTLAPVIGIVQVGEQSMAERYTYVPLVGLFIVVVWLIGDAVAHSPKLKIAAQVLAVVVIAACAVKTNAQVKVWKDTVTLFTHALAIDQRGALPNSSLGAAYVRLGKYAEAQPYLERALYYKPSASLILSFSAFSMMQTMIQTHDMDNMPLAGERLEKALRGAPDSPNVLADNALWSIMAGKPRDAEMYGRKAIAAQPDLVRARSYLADSLMVQNKLDEAIQEYRRILALDPENGEAHNYLGMIYIKQGLTPEAIKEFRLSLALYPEQAMPHTQLAKIYMESHQLSEAVAELTQAVRYDPGNANAHNGLGVALAQMGDYEKAYEQFSEAARIDPANQGVRMNLALVQAKMKSGGGKM